MTQEIQDQIVIAKGPFVVSLEAMDAIPALVDKAEQLKYDEGFAKGQASIVLPEPGTGELIYSQEDADKLASVVRGENDEEVAKLVKAGEEKDLKIVGLESDKVVMQSVVDALIKERDGLREAIKAEVEDSKVDTARLELAIAPIEPVQFR